VILLAQLFLGGALAAASCGPVAETEAESLLMSPLHMGELPPPLWSLRSLSLGFGEGHGRTRKEAAAELGGVVDAVKGGASFRERVIQIRAAAGVGGDGAMGVLPPGVLDPKFDQFLEGAAIGEVSGVVETSSALHLLQRIEPRAAVRQIFIEGEGADAQLLALRAQALDGASFRELAREHSMDRPSAERGGDYAVFERGPRDSLLKRVAFELAVGEISPPIKTPLGWHLLKRVGTEELPSELIEENWARFNVLLITHADSPQAANPTRSRTEARELAAEAHAALSAGDPFEPIARFSNDDPGGKERAGDIGWVHRRMPGLPQYLRTSFLLKAGEVGAPVETGGGWILVQRTR